MRVVIEASDEFILSSSCFNIVMISFLALLMRLCMSVKVTVDELVVEFERVFLVLGVALIVLNRM